MTTEQEHAFMLGEDAFLDGRQFDLDLRFNPFTEAEDLQLAPFWEAGFEAAQAT